MTYKQKKSLKLITDVDLYIKDINESDLVYFNEEGQIQKGE